MKINYNLSENELKSIISSYFLTVKNVKVDSISINCDIDDRTQSRNHRIMVYANEIEESSQR